MGGRQEARLILTRRQVDALVQQALEERCKLGHVRTFRRQPVGYGPVGEERCEHRADALHLQPNLTTRSACAHSVVSASAPCATACQAPGGGDNHICLNGPDGWLIVEQRAVIPARHVSGPWT